MSYFDIPIDPVGAPRMTQRDAWKKRPVVLRYFAFRDVVRYTCNLEKYEIGDTLRLEFHIPIPKSRLKESATLLQKPHDQKPDIDNLCKAFMDCFGEDKTIWKIQAEKRWSDKGYIRVYRQPG